jgi:predicted O-methyltransferase YrrM
MHDETSTYLETANAPADPLLLELEQHARKEEVPLISRSLGRLLSVLVHAMQANRILEIGTAFGYSTLWMALAQPPAGKIWTFDPDASRTTVAQTYFERANANEKIEVVNQPALEVLSHFPQRNLDIVFVDADQSHYEAYLDILVPMLKLSGLAVFPNLLLETAEARAFNKAFLNHPELDATILPLAGGTGIGARKR